MKHEGCAKSPYRSEGGSRMKRITVWLLVLTISVGLCACGNTERLPEEVVAVQRKIDKALDEEPTYEDLMDIRESYDDLLKEEQASILNYDKIQDMFTLSEKDVAAIYTVHQLKDRLKIPSSLELLSVEVASETETMAVKVDYLAANDVGGMLEDTFYCLVDTPIYDAQSKQWSCKLEDLYDTYCNLEIIDSLQGHDLKRATSQEYARDEYEDREAISVEVAKVTDNLELNIQKAESLT